MSQQVDGESVFPNVNVILLASALDHRPHDFRAGGIATCVDDAFVGCGLLHDRASARRLLVELRAPTHKFLDSSRAFTDHHVHDFGIAQIAAGDQRIGDM